MEIGSEFEEYRGPLDSNNSDFLNIGNDRKFTLSGRTAIYYVLKEVLNKKTMRKVYLPSYCCTSMMEPFEDLGIEIDYYDVYFNNVLKYNIEYRDDIDLFFAMNYFGYSNTNMDSIIRKYKQQGAIVIEDITHSFFSTKRYSEYSDYLVGSLRKWMPIASGGIAVNMNSKFETDLLEKSYNELISVKNTAMKNKKEYLENGKEGLKDTYLEQYSKSNHMLKENYKDYSIDSKSFEIIQKIDINNIKEKRIKNAKMIYEKLNKNANVQFLINEYNEEDALLAVPIILPNEKRNDLRKYLIDKEVYLPIHWPLGEKINNIFDIELSLVCDQRYSEEQISDYVDLIIDYLEEKNEK